MPDEHDRIAVGPEAREDEQGGRTTTTRRAFMAGVGRKAAYITPIVLTLSARPALASGFAASCKPMGDPCIRDLSCCSDDCDTGGTNTCNCAPAGKPCADNADCCSVSCGAGVAGICD